MSAEHDLELLPLGKTLSVPHGQSLQSVLFTEGVEFPCGAQGRCRGCRVRVIQGDAPPSADDLRLLSPQDLASGWRLACRMTVTSDLRIELAQWETTILSDDTPFAFRPREGLGLAIDLGTTTLVAQLIDLETAHVLGVRTALNAQAQHGADIMSRIEYALLPERGEQLQTLIRKQIGGLIRELLRQVDAPAKQVKRVTLVGNTAMHHLFCGHPLQPLAHSPFEPESVEGFEISTSDLGWDLPQPSPAVFLPCLGGFVGSDILAGILATRMHEQDAFTALIDLGTNGEIVVGNRERLLCASTAAGPAFEGARISMGMRAATGAIARVHLKDGDLECETLGSAPARGLCGSGLVDATAALLDLGHVSSSGRLEVPDPIPLLGTVTLTQKDIRELQLAKGAIAAGLRLLARQRGISLKDISRIYLAGAFGNYINRDSACRIGLLPGPGDRIWPAGNTALLGAKLALFESGPLAKGYLGLRRRIEHVGLNDDPTFHEIYVEEMQFPPRAE